MVFKALEDEKSHDSDRIFVGPDLLSYDQKQYLLITSLEKGSLMESRWFAMRLRKFSARCSDDGLFMWV